MKLYVDYLIAVKIMCFLQVVFISVIIGNVFINGNKIQDDAEEVSVIILKPDAVQRNLVAAIIGRFEDKGLNLVAVKVARPTEELLRRHYRHLNDVILDEVIEYMTSGPVIPMVWKGTDAVNAIRRLIGATDPKDALPGTIRGDFGLSINRNLIHGSDSQDAALRETDIWFREDEIINK